MHMPAATAAAAGINDGSSVGVGNHSRGVAPGTARLWAVGGQHWLRTKRMEVENNWSATHKRGIFAMHSSSIVDVMAGRWLAHRQKAIATPPIIDGRHSACVERRPENLGVCEFDGKLSLARLRSRFVIYTRANLKVNGGGRYVQAATSLSDDPTAGFGPFAPLRIDGYDPRGPGNIYLAAVKAYPFDPSLLLGLFAVCEGDERRAPTPPPGVDAYNQSADGNTDGRSFTGLALSCNGIDWSSFIEIAPTHSHLGRVFDHPVDGLLLSEGTLSILLHRDVYEISSYVKFSRLVRYELRRSALERYAELVRFTLPGCDS